MTGLPPGLPLRHPAALIATFGGCGLLPRAPGSWASLAALPIAVGIHVLAGPGGLIAAILVAAAAGWWATSVYLSRCDETDPDAVVIDEVIGQWIAVVAVPPAAVYYAGAFLLFRAFDVFKPWPVGWLDRRVGGPLGVILDDVAAGALAAAVMLIGQRLLEAS